ncbi:hypothetical protein D3C80_1614660 [compost metagenome]
MPSGGTQMAMPTPPISQGWVLTWVWANRVATLLTGPPMSKAVMPPRMAPSITLPEPAMLESQWFIPSIMAAMGAPMTHMTMPHTRKVPISG